MKPVSVVFQPRSRDPPSDIVFQVFVDSVLLFSIDSPRLVCESPPTTSQSHSVTVAPLDEGVELTQLSAARLNRGSARTDATSAQGVDSRRRTRSGGAQGHPLEPLRVSFAGPSASSINSESKFVDGRTWDSYRILCRPFYDIYLYHICMVTRAVCFGSCYRTRYTRSSHRNSTP